MILSILQVTVSALAARRIGSGLGRFAGKWSHPFLGIAFETGLGLAFLSYLIFAASCLHWISGKFLWGLWLAMLPLAVWEIVRKRGQVYFPGPGRENRPVPVWLLGGVIYGFWILLSAALPPSDRDELIYQLEVPRQILMAGGFKIFPDNIYAYFPQLANMLTLLGLGTLGEAAARLYQALFGLLTSLAIYGFGRKFLSRTSSLFAAALFLTVPSAMVLMSLAYVDLAYAFYAFLALTILLEDKKEVVRRGLAAGIMAGCAAATKYPGLQWMGLLIIFASIQYLDDRNRAWFKTMLMIPAIGTALILPYLVRNFFVTGWPLFPFPSGTLPLSSSIHWSHEQASLFLLWLGQYGTPLGQAAVLYTLAAPFLVFLMGRFNEPQFYDGVIGPVFLSIPFLLWRVPLTPVIKKLGLFSVLFLYYWAVTTKQIRFLVPVLPVLCLLLAYGLAQRRHWIWKGVVAGMVLANIFLGVRQIAIRDPIPFWIGRESRDAYLHRQLPVYRIYQEVNKRLGSEDLVYLINMKNYGYYLNVPWSADFVFERYRVDQVLEKAQSAEDVAGFFKNLGVTHLMIDEAYVQSLHWGIEPEHLPTFEQFMGQFTSLMIHENGYALYKFISP